MKHKIRSIITLLAVTGLMVGVAWADNQMIPITLQSGTGTGCVGSFVGYAKMTNSSGSVWITPPANTTTGTFADESSFDSNYVSIATVVCLTNPAPICGSNNVTFKASSKAKYELVVYVKSSPPTNGEPLNLQITWQ